MLIKTLATIVKKTSQKSCYSEKLYDFWYKKKQKSIIFNFFPNVFSERTENVFFH
jgi:hypothetical protein